jgi:hypothetical protein
MNKQLFQYAVIFNPTEKQVKEEGLESKVVVELQTVLAKDQNEVSMRAAMSIPEDYKDKLSQIQIAVRPF